MDYYQKEEVTKALVQAIRHSATRAIQLHTQNIDSETVWGASLFYTEVLWNADLPIRTVSRKVVNSISKEYGKVNVPINVDSLFKRFWLREVLGTIQIPSAIRSILFDFNKYRNQYDELRFLNFTYGNDPERVWTTAGFETAMGEYNKADTLDAEWLLDSGFLKKSKVNDTFTIRFSEHYNSLLDYWNDFKFLTHIQEYSEKLRKKPITINVSNFDSILKSHSKCYLQTPGLKYFIDKKLIAKVDDHYVVQNLQDTDVLRQQSEDQIGTLIWRKIVHHNQNQKPEQLVLDFLEKMSSISYSAVFGKNSTKNECQIFVEGTMALVLNERDLEGRENEYEKCRLDVSLRGAGLHNSATFSEDQDLVNAKDITDLYLRMDYMEHFGHNNIFFDQSSRNQLVQLIGCIIEMDEAFAKVDDNGKSKTEHFPSVKKLLLASYEKPFLVWDIFSLLKWRRPEIIPYLLTNQEFDALAYFMLSSLGAEHPYKNLEYQMRTKMLLEAFSLSINSRLQSDGNSLLHNAVFVLRILKWLNKDKYRKRMAGRDVVKAIEFQVLVEQREKGFLRILGQLPEKGHYVRTNSIRLFLPKVIPEIVKTLLSHKEAPSLDRGVLQFPIFKFDALSLLCSFTIKNEYLPEFTEEKGLEKLLAESFSELYLKVLETNELKKLDYKTGDRVSVTPSWLENQERIEKITWWPLFLSVFREGNFKELLAPQFHFKKTDDIYLEQNRFNAKKLRTHFTIILEVLDDIQNRSNESFNTNEDLLKCKLILESQLIEFVEKYGVFANRFSVNIFDKSYERLLYNRYEQLLPRLVEKANTFDQPQRLWDELSKTENLLQLLILADNNLSSGFNEYLLQKLRSIDVEAFITENNWGEVEHTIRLLSRNAALSNEAEIALKYWDKNAPKKGLGNNSEKRLFDSKLMKAFLDKDESAIDVIDEPKSYAITPSEMKPYDQKRFYTALIRFEQKPDNAYNIFNDLVSNYPSYISLALNRFAAKITWAKNENNKRLFQEALQQWEAYEKETLPELLEFVKGKILYNILTVKLHLKDYKGFDSVYAKLDKASTLIVDYVELRVVSLLDRKQVNEAKLIVDEAITFNTYEGNRDEVLLNLHIKLKNKTSSAYKVAEELKNHLSSKHSLTEHLKESFLKPDDFGKNVSKEIAQSIHELLSKIKSIDKLKDENAFNDLLEILVRTNLKNYGLTVKDQSRGGYSQEDKDAGERDLTVLEGTQELAIIEPLNGMAKKGVQSHISKLFNYTSKRQYLFIVVYDYGVSHRLNERWKKYLDDTLLLHTYPKGYELIDNSINDITEELGFKNDSLRVAMSNHGTDTELYHIVANINYKAR